ncbi:glucose-1-phosphate adenylyltransferase large subunit 1-like [Tasmannia lanceolata]|uniref:glucose-1-phosphate adenylyltransferase large subunit 1-like n=1 Tax=Tasmannia lanceolata TaxID=3420 RepID=UPI004063FC8A
MTGVLHTHPSIRGSFELSLIQPHQGRGLVGGHSSSFFGDRVSVRHAKSGVLGTQENHRSCRRKDGFGVSSVLADVAKEFMSMQAPMFAKPQADPKTVASIILGGGAGTRLFPLTRRRAKPAVPIGGGYRLIDVPMSNCINSGINKIYILTQFNSQSLNRHLARTYSFGNGVNFGDGFVEVLAATQRPGESGKRWFQGTADAVRQFIWLFEDAKNRHIENILILSGDHLYRMDYMDFVQKHINSGADISVSCVPVDGSRASDFGLMKIDLTGRICYFNEKPKGESLKSMQVDTTILGLSAQEAKQFPYIASMGIYLFKTEVLLNLLRCRYPTANDFGSEIIPMAAEEHNVQAYLFNDYWEDIGTIKSFFDANLALTDQPPKFHFFDPLKPIFTSPRFLPPTKIEKCQVLNSIISHGCFVRECSVDHSIVGVRSRLEYGAELKDTMMMGADYYQTESERASFLAEGKVPIGVGRNTKIRNCIIDKNAKIGKDVVIANKDNVQEAERPSEGFYIRSGITVVLKNSTISDGTVI